MFNEKNNLTRIIGLDLINYSKIPLLLMLMILISSILILIITNETRLLTTKYTLLTIECNKLNMDWSHLILEKNTLINYNRIENEAKKKLNMQYVFSLQEKIIVKKKLILNKYK